MKNILKIWEEEQESVPKKQPRKKKKVELEKKGDK